MNRTILIKVNLVGSYYQNLTKAFEEVQQTVDEQNAYGYKVVSVTPLIGNEDSLNSDNPENQSTGYGYCFTTGLILIFEEVIEI